MTERKKPRITHHSINNAPTEKRVPPNNSLCGADTYASCRIIPYRLSITRSELKATVEEHPH